MHLLAEASKTFRSALEVSTRQDFPNEWARTCYNLGIALHYQGIRNNGDEAKRLLTEAVAAFLSALEIQTHQDLPQDWFKTQNNLAITYFELGQWHKALKGLG